MNNPTTLSAEELDAAFTAFTTAAPRIHHLRAVRAHIAALTARAEKAEREVEKLQGRINVLLDDLKECGEEAEDDAVRTIRAENAVAALKAEAERLREALEPFARAWDLRECVLCTRPEHPGTQYCAACDGTNFVMKSSGVRLNSKHVRAAKAALSHQADDAGAVTGSEERLREALKKAERRALDYFMIAQRSEEITPEDIAWANEAAARLSSEQQGGK